MQISRTPARKKKSSLPLGTSLIHSVKQLDTQSTDVSILFLDIEGFSRLVDSQQNKFVLHFQQRVVQVLSEFRATPLDAKTVGDGVILYFSSSVDALNVALQIRDLFAESTFWNPIPEIQKRSVRIALHRGPVLFLPDLIEGKPSVFGKSITTAARLEPVVRSNEVWCTDTFKLSTLDQEELYKAFKFEHLGKTELAKGYQERDVYSVRRTSETSELVKLQLPLLETELRLPYPRNHQLYIAFLELDNKSKDIRLIVSAFKDAVEHNSGARVAIEAAYAIFGQFDVVIRFNTDLDINRKIDAITTELVRKKLLKNRQKDNWEFQHMQIDGLVNTGLPKNADSYLLSVSENGKVSTLTQYKPNSKATRQTYICALVRIDSSILDLNLNRGKALVPDFIEELRKMQSIKRCNVFVDDNKWLLEIFVPASNYYNLTSVVDAIESFLDRHKENEAYTLVTYPVQSFDPS
jgi:class 3 adenylate cyclase